MIDIISGVIANAVLMTAFLAWFIAQLLKVVINLLSYGKLDLTRLIGAGGMPSSHTAFVVALAASVGKEAGWGSMPFAIAFVLAAVVMYDAAGVRRATGRQAEVLNRLLSDLYHGTKIQQERLKELIGHSPIEVLAGAILGLLIGLLI